MELLKKAMAQIHMSQAKSVNHPSLVFIKKRTVAVFAIFVILTPFFLSAVHGTHAATSDDLSGRTLTEGRWIVPSASSEAPMMDKFLQDKVNKFMYEKAELKIERDGKVTGGIDSTFDDIEWLNSGLLYAGEVKLMLNGDYDAKENTMSGRFEIKQSAYHSDTNSSVKWDAAGSFKGSRAVDGSFVLTFSGEENWMSEPYSDGGSRSLSYDVVFSDAASTPSASDEGSCYIAFSEARPASFFPFIPTAQAIDSGARFTDFSGEVTVSYGRNYRELEDNLRLAEQDMVLGVGAHINTESDSSAIISFADMTTFCMKEFSRIILMPGDGPQSKLSLLAGKIWANVKSMVKDGSMDVTMNQAVAGIKGTTFVLEDDGSTSTIKVIDGSVEFTSKASGKTEVVNAGETITADENGLGQKTNFDVNAESNSWKNLSSNSGKAPADTKNYLYYLAGVVLLALVGLVIVLIKKKKI